MPAYFGGTGPNGPGFQPSSALGGSFGMGAPRGYSNGQPYYGNSPEYDNAVNNPSATGANAGSYQAAALRGGTAAAGAGSGAGVSAPTSTPVNPLQQTAFNTAQNYQQGLASGQNAVIQNQLASARDDISAGMRSEGQSAMSRGADPTLFTQRALGQGQQYLGKLQTGLTADALQAQGNAVNGVTSAANAAAQNQTSLQLGTMANQNQAQMVSNDTATTQARLNQAPYDRLSSMMNLVAQNRNNFGAFAGGGSQYFGSSPFIDTTQMQGGIL